MPLIPWNTTAFRGIHMQPAKVEAGHSFARDMNNLRIDGDGWLRLRQGTDNIFTRDSNITGIVASQRHVFALDEDGALIGVVGNTETEIDTAGDMEGRLSLVDFNSYVIITSEGDDQGYIIDLREGEDFNTISLGLPPPGDSSFSVNQGTDDTRNQDEGLLDSTSYYYRLTFVALPDDEETPWYGMESPPTAARIALGTTSGGDAIYTEIAGIIFSKDTYPYPDGATHFRIYRSNRSDQTVFRLVHEQEIEALTYIDTQSGDTVEITRHRDYDHFDVWASNIRLIETERLPSEVKQIFRYNDLVWGAAGDRLIYSDLQGGVIVPWGFPAENDIRVQGRVDFCAEINEVLLFGSRDGTWRLTGGTEFDFAVGQISAVGPIDGHAWSKTISALAFVGEAGLYITDASNTVRLSETILDPFFYDKKATLGSVVFFKDNDILFNVTLEEEGIKTTHQIKFEDGYFTKWNLTFNQGTSIVVNNETFILFADGTEHVKRLNWNETANDSDTDTWYWESHPIDLAELNAANRRKRYVRLEFTGGSDNEVTLTVYKDNDTGGTEMTFETRPDSLNPVRIPINRIARRLRFRVSGTGNVVIHGLQMDIHV